MREPLQILILIYVIYYSYTIWINPNKIYVKMYIAGRKYAWVKNCFSTHQRLKKEYLINKSYHYYNNYNNNNYSNNNNKKNWKHLLLKTITIIIVLFILLFKYIYI